MAMNAHVVTTRGHQWLVFWSNRVACWALGTVRVDAAWWRE